MYLSTKTTWIKSPLQSSLQYRVMSLYDGNVCRCTGKCQDVEDYFLGCYFSSYNSSQASTLLQIPWEEPTVNDIWASGQAARTSRVFLFSKSCSYWSENLKSWLLKKNQIAGCHSKEVSLYLWSPTSSKEVISSFLQGFILAQSAVLWSLLSFVRVLAHNGHSMNQDYFLAIYESIWIVCI